MERLPYIDEHRTSIRASPDAAWDALLSVVRRQVGIVPPRLARVWGLTPQVRRGEWTGSPSQGDALPGFEVSEVDRGRRLALRGRHRFSRYALVFDVEPTAVDACVVRARSWAAFPGAAGAAYRALVIGTGGHRVAVRRLLRSIERTAERAAAGRT
jgi:hypothetical protein